MLARSAKPFTTRLSLTQLEDRLAPSATVDLTQHGATGTINGAIFSQYDARPTGTGVIQSFLRIQGASSHGAAQQGYNTDSRPLQFDENRSPQFTRAMHLSAVPVVNFGGTNYYEFLLDVNQKASQPLLSLDQVRVYVGGAGNLIGYDAATNHLAGLSPVYDMDVGADNWVLLKSTLNTGSGSGDMLMYVPGSNFNGQAGDFVYVFSKFGENNSGSSGFQEWAAGTAPLTPAIGSISGSVINVSTGTGLVGATVFIDTNGNGVIDNNEVFTNIDSSGTYSFSDLATGPNESYTIVVLAPSGYFPTDTSGSETVTLSSGQDLTGLDFHFNFTPN